MENTTLNTPQHTSGATSCFPFELLKRITNNFSEDSIIGSGAYGVVYKGVLDSGEEIAVKKLIYKPPDHGSEKQFHNECTNLMRVQHLNIVRLVGYCYETRRQCVEYDGKYVFAEENERALRFEYLEGGSLEKYISDEPCRLYWDKCYKIIRGVCEGLNHLHNGYKDSIFHLDLKPANILLDNNMIPKIGDFGLSRLFSTTGTCTTTTPLGTMGYTPPEYVDKQEISPKFDVFSLGVVIIHLMAGRKHYYDHADNPSKVIEFVCENWENMLPATMWSHASIEVKTCIEIALRCVNSNRQERPTISKIVDDLNRIDIAKLTLTHEIGSTVHRMPLQHLKDITNNFCNERILGRGGFGVVYKGVLGNGKVIAVKRLTQSLSSSQVQFENEVILLMKLKHPNVVQLVGYCYEMQPLLRYYEGKVVFVWEIECSLCLEYLPNGSLDKYISDASSGLNWPTRGKIIEGICYGLQYLHEQSDIPIIHLDLKPANILLHENMIPKITDFGLSRLFIQAQTIHTAITSGTLGYMPPEYIRGIITPMSDIFSLGVIIMEVITGHRDYPYDIKTSSMEFIELELQKWRNVLQKEPGYTSLETDCQQIKRYIQIGLICVNPERTRRPPMNKIINMLQGLESMDWYISNELSSHGSKEEP